MLACPLAGILGFGFLFYFMPLSHYPLLHRILAHWPTEPERPPLLLNGLAPSDWSTIKNEIIKIFLNSRGNNIVSAEISEQHPDIIVLERDPKKQTIEIKKTREFIGQLSLSNFELPIKLGFIPFADSLNIQSQNSLLKTLEEPLKNRYLILGTISKNKLLPTILSRSTIVNLDRVETGFRPVSVMGQEIIKLYEDSLNSSAAERLQEGQIWSGAKTEKIEKFFELIVSHLHTQLIDQLKQGNFEAAQKATRQLNRALDYLNQVQRTSGANPKLLFEAFLLNL